MTKKKYKKVSLTSSDLSDEKQAELKRILPEVFSENKIDWEKLRAILGDKIDERMEKFNFTWAGKGKAIKNVLVPSKLTLKPAQKESIKWDESENLFIEGDNLEVLKLLQKAYFEKVKMIYIDPPYNTGGDFVYRDDFASPLDNYLEQTGQKGDGMSLSTNKETSGRYHSDWLSMMYPRLKLAWNLLRDDGVIFISIDDNEVYRLRIVMDEIFGEENFVGDFIWRKKQGGGQADDYFVTEHEYVLVFQKSSAFKWINEEISSENKFNKEDEKGKYTAVKLAKWGNTARREDRPTMYFPIKNSTGKNVYPIAPDGGEGRWRIGKDRMNSLINNDLIIWQSVDDKTIPYEKIYYSEGDVKVVKDRSIIFDLASTATGTNILTDIFGKKDFFENPKPTELIQFFARNNTKSNDIILDFFAGSGTMAHAIIDQNKEDKGSRKFILVQLPEKLNEKSEGYKAGYKTIADIAKERIRRVIKGYGDKPEPIDTGFKVFKLDKSNYVENNFELDPEKSDEENAKLFHDYLEKAKQQGLFGKTNDLDVVYENIVKEGLSLNSKITKEKIGKSEVYKVIDGERELLICLDEKIASETAKILCDKALKGKLFICLDNALDDSMKVNLALNLELKTI